MTALSRLVSVIPSASASRALRLARRHSFEHFSCCVASRPGLDVLLPQSPDWRMRPHGQASVMVERQGSASEQVAGAWHVRAHGW